MELFYCPSCGSPIVMKDAKYCELCGLDLTPIRMAMEKLKPRGSTISEQMEQLIAPKINKSDSQEEKMEKILGFTNGDYAGKALQLFEGRNVEKDPEFAIECLKMGVKTGDADSELLTAKIEIDGLYNQEKNHKHAQELLLKLAKENNVEAQFLLGKLLGDPSWYKKAAQQGHLESMYKLGCFYAGKLSMSSSDYRTAEQWLLKATEKKHWAAAAELANLYYEKPDKFGNGCAQSAFRYAESAANNDNKKAQRLLSRFYRYGFGCSCNDELADYWRDKCYDTL